MDDPPDNSTIYQLDVKNNRYESMESQQVVEDEDDDQLFPFSTMNIPSAKPSIFKTANNTTMPALSMSVISNPTSSFDEANGMSESRRSHCSTCSTQRSSASDSTHHPPVRPELPSSSLHEALFPKPPQTEVLSNEIASSQSLFHNAPSIMLESHYLDEAASMIGSTATLFPQHHTPSVQVEASAVASSREVGDQWKDFSMLLQQADDSRRLVKPAFPTVQPELLPMVEGGDEATDTSRGVTQVPDPYDNSTSSSVVIVESEEAPTNNNNSRLPTGNYCRVNPMPSWHQGRSQSQQLFHASSNCNERRLAELVGASVTVVGANTFTISIDLSGTSSSPISTSGPNISEQQLAIREAVLDVIGNPDLLRLWCDAIPTSTSLIIIRSSEGARNAIDRSRPVDANREYEGEWIEAICRPGFVVPSSSRTRNCSVMGRYFLDWTSSLSALMGCPRASGTVTMFVERRAGQVSVTLSPFPGNLQVIHRIKVTSLTNGKIRVEDTVRVRRDDEDNNASSFFSCCSNLWDALQQCFLPAMDDYTDQALSSMARLRFLIENGEDAARHGENATIWDSPRSDVLGTDYMNDTLLMSQWLEGSNRTTTDLQSPLLVRLVS